MEWKQQGLERVIAFLLVCGIVAASSQACVTDIWDPHLFSVFHPLCYPKTFET